MNNSREFNFRKTYPGVPEEQITVIQRYFDTNIATINSENVFKQFFSVLSRMCFVLQENKYIMFRDWDAKVAISFLRSLDYKNSSLQRAVPVLKSILIEAGCISDLSLVNVADMAAEYCSPLLSFEILDNTLKRMFYKEGSAYTWNTINCWSSGIVICYLLWLGFTRADICNLKNSNFDERTCTIIYQQENDFVKNRNIAERTNNAVSAYIKDYYRSKSYMVYYEESGWREFSFANGDTFIKTTFGSEEKIDGIVNNNINKLHRLLGMQSSEILTAGRMDRLYFLNKMSNIPITMSNAEIIGRDLGISVPSRVRKGTEIGDLIFMYKSYKTKRETLYQNI